MATVKLTIENVDENILSTLIMSSKITAMLMDADGIEDFSNVIIDFNKIGENVTRKIIVDIVAAQVTQTKKHSKKPFEPNQN